MLLALCAVLCCAVVDITVGAGRRKEKNRISKLSM